MSDEITVTCDGGNTVKLSRGTTVAAALQMPDARGAIAAMVDGNPVDLSSLLLEDCHVSPIVPGSREGLGVLRHSTAHLLAQAVKRLYPQAQVTIGPVIDDGFYYDFDYQPGFSPDDLESIAKEMARIVDEELSVERAEMDRDEAVRMFREMGETYKALIIEGIEDERVSVYRQGEFVDLCRGPHVPSTAALGVYKLTHVAGAYWRGDENNAMLQRIYGTAFADSSDLDAHLERLEEARKRDHRKLGKQLGLYSFHPEAPASPFFHPDGTTVYNLLIDYIRGLYSRYGYEEVITPQILDVDLWHRSGHYENYKDHMYFTRIEDRDFAVKPMNCPTHCLMYGEGIRSYRDLPVRFADFGRLHRFERSGVVHGLARVRSFCQDDAHIFCTTEQISAEVRRVLDMIFTTHRAFGFEETKIYLSTRPEKSIGSDAMWDQAEGALTDVLREEAPAFVLNPGDGAFYGPKIDFAVVDAMKREWQLSTVQLDFSMPDRFELCYINNEGKERRPVMIHRAVLGSLERFIAILLEHTGGALPLWLAPCQVSLLTVTDRQNDYAKDVEESLRASGIRAKADLRNEKLGFKMREAQRSRVPVVAVVGDREVEGGTVAPRLRGNNQLNPMGIDEFRDWMVERNRPDEGGAS
ncbi:MAG: threonine--tRNA ligase [Candidatus Binatia bacterium]